MDDERTEQAAAAEVKPEVDESKYTIRYDGEEYTINIRGSRSGTVVYSVTLSPVRHMDRDDMLNSAADHTREWLLRVYEMIDRDNR